MVCTNNYFKLFNFSELIKKNISEENLIYITIPYLCGTSIVEINPQKYY